MHEELAQELEAQYEMNRSIYEQIERWNELFAEFQEFEVRRRKTFRFRSQKFFFRVEKRQ